MAGRPRQTRINQLSAKSDFLKKLVLNQWVLTRFGIDPLEQYRDGGSRVRPITLLSKTLKVRSNYLGCGVNFQLIRFTGNEPRMSIRDPDSREWLGHHEAVPTVCHPSRSATDSDRNER